jgi:hypothetical protein
MVPTLVFSQLGLVALVCVFLMLCWLGLNDAASPHQPVVSTKPSRGQRSKDPTPFAGLTQRPQCALCEREEASPHVSPPVPPAPPPPTHRRPRTVDTSRHCCPHAGCDYRGWLGRGNLRANGLPTICQPPFVTFLPHLHDRLTTNPARIIARTMTQHGHQDTQQSVANSA